MDVWSSKYIPKFQYEILVRCGSKTTVNQVSADSHKEDGETLLLYRGDEESGRYDLTTIYGYNWKPNPSIALSEFVNRQRRHR